jgi:FkbM family methyltransferase
MDRTAIFSIQEIFNEETYHLPDCEGSRVIVDLGANIGVYSLYASWKYPAAKIYAIEPDLDNAKQLMDNVALNGLNTRIAVVRMAVSATEGNVLLFRNPDSSRGHTLARRSEGELGLIVESKSLEELFEAYKIDSCDLLKMDIEGAEYEVLYGCKPEFLRKIRAMAIEFHPFYPSIPEAKMDRQRYGPDGLTSYLRDNGFTTTRGKHEILYAQRP